ncbi:hypothetical protein P5673_000955 [Acropora cervicornis]|uniref:Uncharacterized protein n=1 Tax=Acropora cervicornis TaxID=6130 RepID=A0AAD9R5N2_ACRCE|nr:hypothetical protein P5673_000955 [Acropora cervicornis]
MSKSVLFESLTSLIEYDSSNTIGKSRKNTSGVLETGVETTYMYWRQHRSVLAPSSRLIPISTQKNPVSTLAGRSNQQQRQTGVRRSTCRHRK